MIVDLVIMVVFCITTVVVAVFMVCDTIQELRKSKQKPEEK